jgi:hypothetical protein
MRFLIPLLLLIPLSAQAQSIVSRTVIDGRAVELLDDNTWRYASAKSKNCRSIELRVEFCGEHLGWSFVHSGNPELSAELRFDDRNGGIIIIDEIGTADGNSLDYMVGAAIFNAADGSGVTEDQITVFDSEDSVISGYPGHTIVYGANFSGLPFVYSNTITVFDHYSVQTITYTVGTQPDDASRNLHSGFVNAMKIEG